MADLTPSIIQCETDWDEIQADCQADMRMFDRLPPLMRAAIRDAGVSVDSAWMWLDYYLARNCLSEADRLAALQIRALARQAHRQTYGLPERS